MKIPAKIKVAHHSYDVIAEDRVWASETKYRGCCASQTLTIKFDKNLLGTRLIETLLHEVLHAIYHEYNIKDEDEEERIITQMSTGLCQVLIENPEFKELFCNEIIIHAR